MDNTPEVPSPLVENPPTPVENEETVEEEAPRPDNTPSMDESDKYRLPIDWNDMPNYGCPYCSHKTPNGTAAIEEHVFDDHPEHLEDL